MTTTPVAPPRMVEFGGWDLSVEYIGAIDEHGAARTAVGLFDVSHIRQIELAGADALAAGAVDFVERGRPFGSWADLVLCARHAGGHVR